MPSLIQGLPVCGDDPCEQRSSPRSFQPRSDKYRTPSPTTGIKGIILRFMSATQATSEADDDGLPWAGTDWLIEQVLKWNELTDRKPAEVEQGSDLHNDGAKSPVYDVGHAAYSGFAQAVDHLHANQALITEARMLHSFAPFSLVRGAMDNAALAVWLLAPTSQEERLTRRLHLAYEDMRQSDEAHHLLGPEAPAPPRPIEVRKHEVIDLAKSLNLDAGAVGGKWTGYEKIVRAAATETPGLKPDRVAHLWRCCSGFAHGRQWASLGLLDREEEVRSPNVQNVRLTTTVEFVMLVASIPALINQRALALFEERRQAPKGPQ